MKTYTCVCGQLIFFQNVACVNCRRELGFLPNLLAVTSLEPAEQGRWLPTLGGGQAPLYRKCQNYSNENVCNWMVPAESTETFCISCRLNEIIPDLSIPVNRELWGTAELAKRRLIYSLLQLKLPMASKREDPERGLRFRFLSDRTNPDGSVNRVMTGHNQGTITLNIAEADDAAREKVRREMHEPYRTLLGDLRHESGHYYWDRLVRDTEFLEPYRALFGDERADYAAALKRHYDSGAPPNWQENFISAYATTHPWEDWAESWAHFLHIQDALEVAHDFGLVGKRILAEPKKRRPKTWLSSRQISFNETILAWSELAVALNSINRSMGLADLYPFVLSQPVVAKLGFISDLVGAHAA
ncbi:MAG TPA: putative zinc-binding peptidase [Candidatus Aquilonibacter sp.]|nr:putative zinc-binding peptidase [Candidatus Aquilonibacter sp.]